MDMRLNMIANIRHLRIPAAGHNLHHDAPEKFASEIEGFLS
jgi:pimeloyl-ACP methyl ester carboxylesterase